MRSSKTNNDQVRRVVILGHDGFIGGHLEKYFRNASPDIEIIGHSYPEVDLTKISDVESIAASFDANTAVITLSGLKRQFGDTMDVFSQNIQMVINLCKVLEKRPVGRLIFFSSAAVYGEDVHNTNITEETPVCPTSYYGLAKYTSERILQKVFDAMPNSTLLMLRPPLIYGPNDKGSTYGPAGFIQAVCEDKQITLWGDATELREFIFIEDITKIVHAVTFNEAQGVLNVSSGQSFSFQDILNLVEEVAAKKIQTNSRERTKDKVDNQFNNEKFKSVLKDFNFTPLKEGISKTYKSELNPVGA